MMSPLEKSRSILPVGAGTLTLLLVASWALQGQERPADRKVAPEEAAFRENIQPLLTKFCIRCHNAEEMESGVRVDQLTSTIEDRDIPLWKGIQKQIADGAMPPEDEPQLSAEQRKSFDEWITKGIAAARSRNRAKNGAVRRLTVTQYRNTLRDLLGIEEDLTDSLPPDGTSKDGFTNNAQVLALSPLQVETYFDIAEQALDQCIVDENAKPVIQNFRMDLGASINPQPCPDKLVLGALSMLLKNEDFVVTELQPKKPFEYRPFAMQTKFEFIEGYVGNDTIRAWKKFDSIYHAVFACVRGTPGYPKGEAVQTVSDGLLLRPAIPSPEIFGQSNTYGPMSNFKISLRELPDEGNFRIRVKAARYDDGLLLDAGSKPFNLNANGVSVSVEGAALSNAAHADGVGVKQDVTLTIPQAGVYQVDLHCKPGKSQGLFSLELNERHFAGQLFEPTPAPTADKEENTPDQATAFLLVRLRAGELKIKARYGDNSRLRRIVFSRQADGSDSAKRFKIFEQRTPSIGVYLGLRRDCGSTLTQVGEPERVVGSELREYVFSGAIRDFPNTDVEKDNVNYLAGVREIGVRSEYTDGRDMPRMLVRSVEFEGPFYDSWPPATHRRIFIESPHQPVGRALLPVPSRAEATNPDKENRTGKSAHPTDAQIAYAEDIIRSFATRAFRRPITDAELQQFLAIWKNSFDTSKNFRQSIKDTLLVVLTSPQFLFLIENSRTPDAEDLDSFELASKLSYFLWNAPPDSRLLELASKNELHRSLDAETERMIRDPRFGQFINEFASQWLSLDKFDVVAVDAGRFPKLTRDTKTQLRQEPIQFLRHLIENNLSVRNLLQSDFVVANEVVASYYDLADRTESGFRFVPIQHENTNLGGVLTQASILAGLSDGRESNPVKRGAWFARKIIAEPPDDPPPNVPKLPEDDASKLTLREKLERHRNQKGCVKCHTGIDPWGLPFESFDAGGLPKKTPATETKSKLPDGTEVADLIALKRYLAQDRIDQVAFSVLKHLATYAVGRSLTYNEQMDLREQAIALRASEYRMQDLIRFVINSDAFLKK
jgi:hypothetical protein